MADRREELEEEAWRGQGSVWAEVPCD
jgi:hypothetical protein